jgi:hypothetical protein
MNAKEFVSCWKIEKENLLKLFTESSSGSAVSGKIKEMNLSASQQGIFQEIIDGVLTDTFYTLLLGLDGGANIGGVQQRYGLLDEKGTVISSYGDIEAEAWKQFQDK